jgi:RNA polymerase sigma-70 factor (ECF subfamily)
MSTSSIADWQHIEHAASRTDRLPLPVQGAEGDPGRAGVLDAVVRARSGDHGAFEALARRSAPRMEAVARLILRDPDLAADAAQDALIRAWRDLPGLRDPAAFDTWLHRLVIRASLDVARRRRRAIAVEGHIVETMAAGDHAPAAAERDEMERAFERLDHEQRAILALRFYADLDVPDVAIALGIPLGTAKSRLHRALAALRAALAADARSSRRSWEVGR